MVNVIGILIFLRFVGIALITTKFDNCNPLSLLFDRCPFYALHYLLDNILIRFGSKLYRQIVGIPMGMIALKAPGRDCTNNSELLHKIGVLRRYAMKLFVFTRELLKAIRWRSKYNGCTLSI